MRSILFKRFRHKLIFLYVFIGIGLILPGSLYAQNVIMVDNYNDGNQTVNTLGYWAGWGSSGTFTVEESFLHMYNPDSSKNNNARRMVYDCPGAGDYAWVASNVWDDVAPLDATGYDYVSFRLKKVTPLAGFYVKIQYGYPAAFETGLLLADDYAVETGEWQLVNMPLDDFPGLDKSSLRSIVLAFDSTLPATSGTIAIDNLEISKGYAKPESTGLVRIDRIAKTLLLDGQPFAIESVGYQPYPIGTWPGNLPQDDIDSGVYDRDFPLIVAMGCNTIRTWGDPPMALLNKAEEYGLKVMACFWIDPYSDYADPVTRGNIKSAFTDYIALRKDSPAVLMWGLGNENNYKGGFNAAAYYSLANELAEIAYQQEGATYHPVFIVNGGLYWMGVDEAGAEDLQLNFLDAWGSNLYAQDYNQFNWLDGVRDIFEVYRQKTVKPLVITEYGIDAFNTTQIDWDDGLGKFVASAGFEDETMQANWDESNTQQIIAAADVCMGSSLMEYCDEWWKDMDGSLFDHDLGGGAWWDGGQPDNFSNEEYYGAVEIAPDGTWSAPDGLDDVQVRQVYYTLQGIFGGVTPPEPEVVIVDDYNDGDPNSNTLGYWTGGNPPSMSETLINSFDGTQCRMIRFLDYRWYASTTWDEVAYLDASNYESLSFAIKGKKGGESMRFELQHSVGSIASVDFSGTTTEWQEIDIPLSGFTGLDASRIRAVSVVFYGSGTIYLDNISFTKTGVPPANQPPAVSNIPDQTIDEGGSFAAIALDGYVVDPDSTDSEITWTSSGNVELIVNIDPATRIATVSAPSPAWTGSEVITFRATDPSSDFDEDAALFTVNPLAPGISLIVDDYNDGDPNTNSLGYWTGGSANISETTAAPYDGTKCRRIIYWRSSWYSTNVWDGLTYTDIGAYNDLSFAVKGVKGNERFNITIYYGAASSSRIAFSDVTDEWQWINIPLTDFTGLNKSQIKYIGIEFGTGGTIYLDNIGLSN
ncbi:MAG: hypothetical protein ISS26_04445 [Candidatus Omnitrophica bacterium]|nr:hypothetical protein [Candidatus Omnitrophota bacterium]